MSFDDPEENQQFAEDEDFLFEMWSDSDKTLALYYGAIRRESEVLPGRVTRILDRDGTLLVEYDDVDVGTSPGLVLEDCGTIFGGE